MQIWVDADACPRPIKEILYRAARRAGVRLTLVANHALSVPPSDLISAVQVPSGFDVAENHIVQQCRAGDLVVTGDIPLAAAAIEHGAHAINPRGEEYLPDTIRQRLALRDFMEQLRNTGQVSGGPPPLGNVEKQAFANALDRLLARRSMT